MIRATYLIAVVITMAVIMWPFLEKLQEIAKAVQ